MKPTIKILHGEFYHGRQHPRWSEHYLAEVAINGKRYGASADSPGRAAKRLEAMFK